MHIKALLEKLGWYIGEVGEDIQFMYEQASGRGDMKKIVWNLGEIVIGHICKIVYLKHEMPTTVHHWCAEITAPLNWIINKGLKGGKLTTNLLVDWLNDGLNGQEDMEGRRIIVAKQEKISINKCKPLEDTDYKTVLNILTKLCEKTIYHKYKDYQNISIEEIEEICK